MHESSASFFNLESPPVGAALAAGRQQLRGWLVPKTGHHFVNVRARVGTREFAGVYGFPRADLAAHFEPSRPWLPAEFTIDIDFAPGAAEVQIDALDLTGHWQPFHRVTFTIQDALASAQPAPDAVSAEEFGLAMQLGFVQGQPVFPPYPRIARQDHLPFRGYIVEPAAIAPALYGQMEVVGWLFHETQQIRRAFVTTDLLAFQSLETGGEFAGVKARYPDQPHAGNCRLRGLVDVSSRLPTPACIRIYAELSDGSTHLCLAVRCRPIATEELKKTCAPFSLWKFWRNWRDLKKTFAQRNLPVEIGPAPRREFWSTLRRCRQVSTKDNRVERPAAPSLPAPSTERKLRLLLITHNLNFEGAPLLFVEYARHLVEKCGFTVAVITPQDGPLRAAFEVLGASVAVVDASASSPPELEPQLGAISRQIDWKKIDLVVANTLSSFWGVTLANSAGRPSLLYIHESTSPAAFFRRTTPALLPAVYDAFDHATAVSFNTPATRAYYATLGSGKNFHLNSAWIDLTSLAAFRAANARNTLRASLALQPGDLLVANVGTVCERKGQHDFLRAIEWLWRRAPKLAARCRFVMVGGRNTRYNQSLQKDLAALGREHIQVIPETSRAHDYFGAADLFVCSSYEESFPRVVLEAMAFAVPIVSTDVHGIPYMLRHETEAILVAPGDIDALTGGMLRLLENPAEAKQLAQRAQTRVAEFSADNILPKHAAFTAQVAAFPV